MRAQGPPGLESPGLEQVLLYLTSPKGCRSHYPAGHLLSCTVTVLPPGTRSPVREGFWKAVVNTGQFQAVREAFSAVDLGGDCLSSVLSDVFTESTGQYQAVREPTYRLQAL